MVQPAISLSVSEPLEEQRLRRIVGEQLELVWRTLRRLGVPEAELEDATQRVFLIVSQKLTEIVVDRERSFAFGTALRVASHARRAQRRRREEALEHAGDRADTGPNPEDALAHRQALEQLGEILDSMPEALRTVFMLYELEQMTMIEIAAMDQLPLGTVASRLRRAREHFQREVQRLSAISEGN